MTKQCFLTVDLEDYKHATMRDMGIAPTCSGDQVVAGIHRILDIVTGSHGAPQVTFFTTGQIARAHPALIEELARGGHEIACHTDQHDNVFAQTRAGFLADLRTARAALQDASGQAVVGFRAPNFSIDTRTPWALECLAQAGFLYDSSLMADLDAEPSDGHGIQRTAAGAIYEIPILMRKIGPMSVRVIGGTYFRLFPLEFSLWLLRDAVKRGFTPIVYLHASDLIADGGAVSWSEMAPLSTLTRLGWSARQHQWTARVRSVPARLRALLSEFPNVGPMKAALPI